MRIPMVIAIASLMIVGCATTVARQPMQEDPEPDFEALLPDASVRLPRQEEVDRGHVVRGARPFERAPHDRPNPFAPGTEHVTFNTSEVGVEFHIFSIGQADSMLVIAPNGTTLLFDLGELNWNTRTNCLHVRDEVHALTGEFHVDYLVVSHFHQDHVGGPPRVITSSNGTQRQFSGGGVFCLLEGGPDWFTVGTLIDRGDGELAFEPQRQDSHQWIIDSTQRWIDSGTLVSRASAAFADGLIDMGPGIRVEVLAVAGHVFQSDPGALSAVEQANPGTYSASQQASPNDFSIALEFTVGSDFELFTAGDLSGAPGPDFSTFTITPHHQVYTNVESHMVSHWANQSRESDVEVYVANHHGSHNSSTPDLVNALAPEVVIYSAGGRYGHPKQEIADRFLAAGSDQLVTHSADETEWPGGVFPAEYGNGWNNPVGDILVFAPMSGSSYTVATQTQAFEYPILTDAEEQ